jgi:hypothetical protein
LSCPAFGEEALGAEGVFGTVVAVTEAEAAEATDVPETFDARTVNV